MTQNASTAPCRLCDGTARYRFSRSILGRHEAGYYQCAGCGSLFTEVPSWLDEAYGFPGTTVDVGSALRPLQNWLLLVDAFEQCGFDPEASYLDFGANTGLLARLMRYSGFNFASYDKYVTPYYSDYNLVGSLTGRRCFGVTAFEVLEHLPHPRVELDGIFAMDPTFVVCSTQLYSEQGPDWDYLAPYCGQHVFFYTERALREVAERRGYTLAAGATFQLFVKRDRAEEKGSRVLRDCLLAASPGDAAAARVLLGVLRGNAHIERDHRAAIDRFTQELGASTLPGTAAGADGDVLLRRELARVRADLDAVAKERKADGVELERVRGELRRLSGSTSWQVTLPLRWLHRTWGSLKRTTGR